jgi:hypothetical protein
LFGDVLFWCEKRLSGLSRSHNVLAITAAKAVMLLMAVGQELPQQIENLTIGSRPLALGKQIGTASNAVVSSNTDVTSSANMKVSLGDP